jgi:predicted unusual protein kinase regulating ubiquinone biosynthesis (AarF/ABC1/UbiB family)
MRTAVILARLLPFVLSVLRDRRRWLVAGAPIARTHAFHERRAARLVAALAELGPTFVKLAQVFASRADLVPEPYLAAFGTLTDQVPPVPTALVEAEIQAAYGRPVDEVFEGFERTPLAAASLGQVHRARYGGEDVVVKVLRPGVERLVRADVAAAQRILAVMARWWRNHHVIALQTVVAEFARRVWDEMDFRQEGAYAAEIRANFARTPTVVVPRVLADLTRQRVLVLEYVEGRRIDQLQPWIAEGRVSARRVVQTVMELYLQMMLVDGLFHADPHPGNLLLTKEGRVVILDFGMVVRVPRELRVQLVQTVFAAIREDVGGMVRGFQSLGVILPEADLAEIESLVRRLLVISNMRQTTTTERLEHLLADEVMHALYDAPVALPSELVYFARTASLIEGLGTRYDPYFNATEFASPILLRMRGRITASLRGDEPARPDDWAAALGALAGEVATVVHRAGREIFSILGARFFGSGLPEPLPALREPEKRLALPAAS